MRISAYSDSDFADVVALWQACRLNVPWNDPAVDIPRIRNSPQARLFVGRLGETPIGTVMAGDDGHRGWLYYVAVHPDYRRQGHGRALVRHAEAWLAARAVPKAELLIRGANLDVRDFYVRLGYEAADRLVMQRWLRDEIEAGARQIDVVITHLEMTAMPKRPTVPAPPGRLALLRLEQPSVPFYRYLYNSVGEPWFWWERRRMDDETLRANITDEKVDIYVLYVGGEPAGYAELDRRPEPTVNLAYFGLLPQFTGKGFGTYFLNWAIDQAWSHTPRRLTVDTCTLDDARALRTYQKAGFSPYKQERKQIDDPRLSGLIPAHLEPRRP